jgi:hypothetical protein
LVRFSDSFRCSQLGAAAGGVGPDFFRSRYDYVFGEDGKHAALRPSPEGLLDGAIL